MRKGSSHGLERIPVAAASLAQESDETVTCDRLVAWHVLTWLVSAVLTPAPAPAGHQGWAAAIVPQAQGVLADVRRVEEVPVDLDLEAAMEEGVSSAAEVLQDKAQMLQDKACDKALNCLLPKPIPSRAPLPSSAEVRRMARACQSRLSRNWLVQFTPIWPGRSPPRSRASRA